MAIDRKKIINNKLFILVAIIVIVLFIVIALLVDDNKSKIYESELEETGNPNINKLVINEYMSSNKGTHISKSGEIYDWIELYNGTNEDINLKNYGLSDNSKIKWTFPEITIEKKSYLVVYLSGKKKDGLYAPFKLKSSGGEELILKNPSGTTLDKIDTIALDSNQSVARNLNGKFVITDMPTPGYPNTKEGYNELYSSLEIENNGIRISEVLVKNAGNFSIDGKYPSYIEIVNTNDEEISLDGYYLSDDINKLYKYRINDISLKKNEVKVIFMGENIDDENTTSTTFKLDNKFGKVYLSNKEGKIITKIEYDFLSNGVALTLINNSYYETSTISPGYLNNSEGENKFSNEYLIKPKTLIINEIMNNNTSYLSQNGEFYDWIELYNNSEENIKLSDYTLSTNTNNIELYKLPEITLKKGEYYVLLASGDPSLSNNNYKHTNFKLSDIESLYLYKDKKIVDSMFIYNIPLNYSYGRGENGFYYMENPTPLKQNNKGVRSISYAPNFSVKPGVYNDVENIKLEIDSVGDVYYTLDGNTPTKNSKKYTEPIILTKTTVINAITYEEGKSKSEVVTGSYIINENHTLPVLSMSISPSNLNRIIAGAWSFAEAGGNLEFYEDTGSFNTPCAISLFGGSARSMPKKSYGIKFKSKYGAGSLNYKLFDNRDTSVYQSIVIRSGSQDYNLAFIRDILGTSLVDDYTDVDVQAYKSAILYINGQYYGVFNIREKVNPDFIANHYNVDPDKTNIFQGNWETKAGSRVFYNNVINFVNTHNMALDSNYEKIKEMIDIENIIDFWIAESYVTNNDIINIRYFSHPDIDDGKMKMIYFDLDYAWYWPNQNYYLFMTNPSGMTERFHVNTDIMRNLMKNKQFKTTYLERLKYNLENTWKKENVLKRLNEIYEKLLPEMPRNQKRWGLTMETWNSEINKLKQFIEKRQTSLLNQTKAYFNLSDEEYKKYFGGIS